jgi:hypothetical protein
MRIDPQPLDPRKVYHPKMTWVHEILIRQKLRRNHLVWRKELKGPIKTRVYGYLNIEVLNLGLRVHLLFPQGLY